MNDKMRITIEIPYTGLEEGILRKGEWDDDSLFGRSLRNALMHFTKESSEQVSSGDLISREATLTPYKGLNDEDTISVWLIRKNIEQQPSINLQSKTDVFDTINAEIEETYRNISYQENKDRKATWGLRKALEIIAKYKEEIEKT